MKFYSFRLHIGIGRIVQALAIIIFIHFENNYVTNLFRSFVCYVDHGMADGQKAHSHCTSTLHFISLQRKKEKLNIDLSCKCMSIDKCSSMKPPIKLQKRNTNQLN